MSTDDDFSTLKRKRDTLAEELNGQISLAELQEQYDKVAAQLKEIVVKKKAVEKILSKKQKVEKVMKSMADRELEKKREAFEKSFNEKVKKMFDEEWGAMKKSVIEEMK